MSCRISCETVVGPVDPQMPLLSKSNLVPSPQHWTEYPAWHAGIFLQTEPRAQNCRAQYEACGWRWGFSCSGGCWIDRTCNTASATLSRAALRGHGLCPDKAKLRYSCPRCTPAIVDSTFPRKRVPKRIYKNGSRTQSQCQHPAKRLPGLSRSST